MAELFTLKEAVNLILKRFKDKIFKNKDYIAAG